MFLVTKCVHWLPESGVVVCDEFTLLGQRFEWFPLENGRIPFNVLKNARREYKKSGIDGATISGGLLGERANLGSCSHEGPKASTWPHRGDGSEFIMRLVECDQSGNINVGNPVAVGHAECFIVGNKRSYSFQAASSLREFAGVDQRYAPGFSGRAVES